MGTSDLLIHRRWKMNRSSKPSADLRRMCPALDASIWRHRSSPPDSGAGRMPGRRVFEQRVAFQTLPFVMHVLVHHHAERFPPSGRIYLRNYGDGQCPGRLKLRSPPTGLKLRTGPVARRSRKSKKAMRCLRFCWSEIRRSARRSSPTAIAGSARPSASIRTSSFTARSPEICTSKEWHAFS
jgi:hypothetical protein